MVRVGRLVQQRNGIFIQTVIWNSNDYVAHNFPQFRDKLCRWRLVVFKHWSVWPRHHVSKAQPGLKVVKRVRSELLWCSKFSDHTWITETCNKAWFTNLPAVHLPMKNKAGPLYRPARSTTPGNWVTHTRKEVYVWFCWRELGWRMLTSGKVKCKSPAFQSIPVLDHEAIWFFDVGFHLHILARSKWCNWQENAETGGKNLAVLVSPASRQGLWLPHGLLEESEALPCGLRQLTLGKWTRLNWISRQATMPRWFLANLERFGMATANNNFEMVTPPWHPKLLTITQRKWLLHWKHQKCFLEITMFSKCALDLESETCLNALDLGEWVLFYLHCPRSAPTIKALAVSAWNKLTVDDMNWQCVHCRRHCAKRMQKALLMQKSLNNALFSLYYPTIIWSHPGAHMQ